MSVYYCFALVRLWYF